MIREGHLSVYDLTLTTRSPLALGNSRVINKTGYIFDPRNSLLTVLDAQKMFQLLLDRDLAEQYEQFIFSGQTNMFRFLVKECGFSDGEIRQMSLYRINTAGALDEKQILRDIIQITRTSDGRVYIPGSSVKGALRTALLLGPVSGTFPRGDEHLTRDYSFREGSYFNKIEYLNAPERDRYHLRNNPSSSIAQGIRISDSVPISGQCVALATKVDVALNGESRSINLMWECIPPKTQLHFKLTLDHSILDHCEFNGRKGISVDTLMQAVSDYSVYYQEHFVSKFQKPVGCSHVSFQNALLMGANTGYFAKTMSYPYWKDRALEEVSGFMQTTFPAHGHRKDPESGISPHMLNYGRYNGKLYPMGLCEVSIR